MNTTQIPPGRASSHVHDRSVLHIPRALMTFNLRVQLINIDQAKPIYGLPGHAVCGVGGVVLGTDMSSEHPWLPTGCGLIVSRFIKR